MPRQEKYQIGERVQIHCEYREETGRTIDWVWGTVIFVDRRMVQVECEKDVYDTLGQYRPDRKLWCTHGSRKLRRPHP